MFLHQAGVSTPRDTGAGSESVSALAKLQAVISRILASSAVQQREFAVWVFSRDCPTQLAYGYRGVECRDGR
jgi:hypothetical protein